MKKLITIAATFTAIFGIAYFVASGVNAKSISASACSGTTYCQ